MNKNYGKLKSIMFSIALAVGMLLPASSFAQSVEAETGGGLFGFGKLFGFDGFMYGENLNEEPIEVEGFGFNSGLFGKDGAINDNITVGITNGSFGEEVPLGGGIAILLVAGLGYVAIKKKEDEQ
jgi:hypothetical protein